MRVPLLDLPAQVRGLGAALDEALAEVTRSQLCVMGPAVTDFEGAMATYCGVRHALGVGSGTDALVLALEALGVGPGTTVVTTPFSFFATGSSIARLGARPLFVDVDPETLNLDVDGAAKALAEHDVAGIVPVHLFGRMAPMEALRELAARHEVWILEDAAQAVGARTPDGMAGSLGRAGCLSFYPTKNLGGMGDAGMVLTSDDVLAERVRVARSHGTTGPYFHESIGLCSRMDSFNAAALRVKLPHLDAWNERRRTLAARYDAGLRAAGVAPAPLRLPPPANRAHVVHQYVVRTRDRDRLARHLAEAEVATQVFYPTLLNRQPALASYALAPYPLDVAERATREVLALPIYPELTEEQVDYVVAAIAAFYASR